MESPVRAPEGGKLFIVRLDRKGMVYVVALDSRFAPEGSQPREIKPPVMLRLEDNPSFNDLEPMASALAFEAILLNASTIWVADHEILLGFRHIRWSSTLGRILVPFGSPNVVVSSEGRVPRAEELGLSLTDLESLPELSPFQEGGQVIELAAATTPPTTT